MGIFTLSTSTKIEVLLVEKDWVKIRIITGVYDGGFLIDDSEKVQELVMKAGDEHDVS